MANSLSVGDKAPEFSLKSQTGKAYRLTDLKGKWVVLYFYPKDDTPGCTKQACSIRDFHGEFQKRGIEVFGISIDDEKSHADFASKFSLPFPLLADTAHSVSLAYGAFSNGKYSDRFTYVIAPDQTISHIFKKVNVDAHAQEVLAVINNH
ncbi:MAG: peroxiredoxin [Oligoflexia bacterium]|nr:peroxiredoxin [Oligoflexia bacterium]